MLSFPVWTSACVSGMLMLDRINISNAGFPPCCHWVLWYFCFSSWTDLEVYACIGTQSKTLPTLCMINICTPNKILVDVFHFYWLCCVNSFLFKKCSKFIYRSLWLCAQRAFKEKKILGLQISVVLFFQEDYCFFMTNSPICYCSYLSVRFQDLSWSIYLSSRWCSVLTEMPQMDSVWHVKVYNLVKSKKKSLLSVFRLMKNLRSGQTLQFFLEILQTTWMMGYVLFIAFLLIFLEISL